MIGTGVLLTYILACAVIVAVPGPSVSMIVANSLSAGSRAGLANVAGTQAGLFLLICILALGLDSIMAYLASVFVYLKLAGAAYLIFLGVKLFRSNGALAAPRAGSRRKKLSGYFWQGFFVICSNPKVLFFFGAFIPQFLDPAGNTAGQTFLLGLIFMAVATVLDSAYALLAGRAGAFLGGNNIRLLERMSGLCLIGGGLWLAFTRRV